MNPKISHGLEFRPMRPFLGLLASFLLYCIVALGASSAEQLNPAERFFITNSPPRDYSESEFKEALLERFTPKERALVVNPLASTAEMDQWARALTSKATNELDKARAIFDALLRPPVAKPGSFESSPTAQEVFAACKTPESTLHCHEFAILYVALARAVGLKSYEVYVQEDCRGLTVLHECASVFTDRGALLVDPAYSWFGVPHKKFTVLNDLQLAGMHLCSQARLNACQAGCKLAPEIPLAHDSLFQALQREDRWPEAREELAEEIRLDPDGPMTLCSRAEAAFHDGNIELAIALARKAAEVAPETPQVYVLLGSAFAETGKLNEARNCYQTACRLAAYQGGLKTAKQALAVIDARELETQGNWAGALTNLDLALQIGPEIGEVYCERGVVKQQGGDLAGALADFDKAIALKPRWAQAVFFRGQAKVTRADWDGAKADYDRAIEPRPGWAEVYVQRGYVKERKGDQPSALQDYKKAKELNPAAIPWLSSAQPSEVSQPGRWKRFSPFLVPGCVAGCFGIAWLLRRVFSSRRAGGPEE